MNSFVAITGGEPGVASKEHLNYIYKVLKEKNCIIQVNTNGTFFKTQKELCKITDYFLYHCSENLSEPIYIPDTQNYKIFYTLVITNNSYKRLENYIDKYPIIFQIVGADKNSGEYLNFKNAIKIYQKYKFKITPDSFYGLLTRYSVHETINHI